MTKERAVEILEEVKMLDDSIYQYNPEYLEALDIAIQAIKDLDKMNGIALDLASENDDLIEKLDSIRAEIEALPKTYPFINHIDSYVKEDDVKKIIDKYRGKSKDADTN